MGDTVLCKQEKKNSLTPLFDPVPMVVIGIKGDMLTAKNNQRIRTRNYADWNLLKDGCRHSAACDESDDEDVFMSFTRTKSKWMNTNKARSSTRILTTRKKDGRYAIGPGGKSHPRRAANTKISFAIKIKETAAEIKQKRERPSTSPWNRTLVY